jgi:hypothetical protein
MPAAVPIVQLTGKKKVDPAMAQKILSQRVFDVDMNGYVTVKCGIFVPEE